MHSLVNRHVMSTASTRFQHSSREAPVSGNLLPLRSGVVIGSMSAQNLPYKRQTLNCRIVIQLVWHPTGRWKSYGGQDRANYYILSSSTSGVPPTSRQRYNLCTFQRLLANRDDRSSIKHRVRALFASSSHQIRTNKQTNKRTHKTVWLQPPTFLQHPIAHQRPSSTISGAASCWWRSAPADRVTLFIVVLI